MSQKLHDDVRQQVENSKRKQEELSRKRLVRFEEQRWEALRRRHEKLRHTLAAQQQSGNESYNFLQRNRTGKIEKEFVKMSS
jgi:hypothetical protein